MKTTKIFDLLVDKMPEIYKARLTVGLALLLAMITITGFAFQNRNATLFLLASVFPLIILSFDLIVKWFISAPVWYNIMAEQTFVKEEEPVLLVFDFGNPIQESKYRKIMEMEPGAERQRAFRRLYVFRLLPIRIVFTLAFVFIEYIFWIVFSKQF